MPRLKPGIIRLLGRVHAWLWQTTRAKCLGSAFGRGPFLILTTKGRRTGRLRATPLLYLQDGADFIVVGSFGGNDAHPAWYLNLRTRPEAEVTVAGERRRVFAHEVSPEEKGLLWPRLVELYPNFGLYKRRTPREIPVLRLSEPAR